MDGLRAYLYAERGKPHQLRVMQEFALGLGRHGIWPTVGHDWGDAAGSDFVVRWGDGPVMAMCPQLILEAGHLTGPSGDYETRRLRYISIGWNGLHGRADPLWNDYSEYGSRWRSFEIRQDRWRREKPGSGYILALGQHPNDATAPAAGMWATLRGQASAFGPIRHRPHPLIETPTESLASALFGAAWCFTWNSTAAVEAVIAGVPTVTFDPGSIAWPVTSHTFDDPLYRGGRTNWLYNLAYRNWTMAELASGDAWWHIRHGLVSGA